MSISSPKPVNLSSLCTCSLCYSDSLPLSIRISKLIYLIWSPWSFIVILWCLARLVAICLPRVLLVFRSKICSNSVGEVILVWGSTLSLDYINISSWKSRVLAWLDRVTLPRPPVWIDNRSLNESLLLTLRCWLLSTMYIFLNINFILY